MKIGILGAAIVGLTLADKLGAAGHEVKIANSGDRENLAEVLMETGTPAKAAAASEVLASDVVFLALPWSKVSEVLMPDIAWNGRILVDATNIFASYGPDRRIADLGDDSGSEIVTRLAPSARVVKAFNTLPFSVMFATTPPNTRRVLFVAGDDRQAVATVSSLIGELGLHPVPLGSLATAGRQMELGGPLSSLELLAPVPARASA